MPKTREEALAKAERKLTLEGHPGQKAGDIATVADAYDGRRVDADGALGA
jgi:hypothetical protein